MREFKRDKIETIDEKPTLQHNSIPVKYDKG